MRGFSAPSQPHGPASASFLLSCHVVPLFCGYCGRICTGVEVCVEGDGCFGYRCLGILQNIGKGTGWARLGQLGRMCDLGKSSWAAWVGCSYSARGVGWSSNITVYMDPTWEHSFLIQADPAGFPVLSLCDIIDLSVFFALPCLPANSEPFL